MARSCHAIVTLRARRSSPGRTTAPWNQVHGAVVSCAGRASGVPRAQNERQLSMKVLRSARREPMEAVAFSTLQLSYW